MITEATNVFIEGAVQLLSETEEKVRQGELWLTAEDWAKLHSKMGVGRTLLEMEEVGEEALEEVALLMIKAFDGHQVLGDYFAPRLDVLRSEPYELGVPLRGAKKKRIVRKNQVKMLDFIKFAEERAQSGTTQGQGDEHSNQNR